jgi:hypothetical protein
VGGASGATGYCYGAAQPVVVMAKAGVGKVKTSTRFTVLLEILSKPPSLGKSRTWLKS